MGKVRVSDQWMAPQNSAYGDWGSTHLAGQVGEVLTQNTMGESLIKFDDASLGEYWVSDDFVEEVRFL